MAKEVKKYVPVKFDLNEEYIWGISENPCLLVKYLRTEENPIYCTLVPAQNRVGGRPFSQIKYYDGRVFLVPSRANEILMYEESKDKFVHIELQNAEKYKGRLFFNSAFTIDEYLYCVPTHYEAVVKLNMNTLEVQNMCNPLEYFDLKDSFINDACIRNEIIYFVSPKKNQLFSVDTKNGKMDVKEVGAGNNKYNSIAGLENGIVLCDKKKKELVKYDLKIGKVCKVCNLPIEDARIMALGKSEIVVDAIYTSQYCILNSELEIVFQNMDNVVDDSNSYMYGSVKNTDANIYYYDMQEKCLKKWDGKDLYSIKTLYLNEQEINKISSEILEDRNIIIRESQIYSLENFLNGLENL